jgi:hypothetical protein
MVKKIASTSKAGRWKKRFDLGEKNVDERTNNTNYLGMCLLWHGI